MKNKKGFTLVELLAVIAILAILVIIALPNVINMYNKAQKETFLTEAKNVYRESEKVYLSNAISGKKTKVINSEDSSKLDMTGSKLQYCVILNNSGKVTDMKVSNGKWVASLKDGKTVEDLTIDDLEDGNLDGYNCKQNAPKIPEATNCTFDGDLVQGVEYVNGQYTYRYMQEGNASSTNDLAWNNIVTDGWGVQLTDKASTDAVTDSVCTYINNVPVTSMAYMYYKSKTSSINLTNVNTSKVTSMSDMFRDTQVTSLDLSNFDTSNVTNMLDMFRSTKVETLDLSSFDTSNVTDMFGIFCGSQIEALDLSNFDTSNVTDMQWMFDSTQATSINVNSFDTSKVTNMSGMFSGSQAATLDVSSFDTSNVTNMSSMFQGGTATTIKGLNKFNTSKVTNMNYMFNRSQVTSLDLSNFDTSNVTDMSSMFRELSLSTIYVSDKFVTNKVTVANSANMFTGSTKLVGGAGTKYTNSYVNKTYARIDGGTTNPGYFTKK